MSSTSSGLLLRFVVCLSSAAAWSFRGLPQTQLPAQRPCGPLWTQSPAAPSAGSSGGELWEEPAMTRAQKTAVRYEYNVRIYEAGKLGQWWRCLELLDELEREALAARAAAPDEYTLNALLVGAVNPAGGQGRSNREYKPPDMLLRGPGTALTSVPVVDEGIIRRRVAVVWRRLVGTSAGRTKGAAAVRAAGRRSVYSAGNGDGDGGTLPFVSPDRVSLNTALKQWFFSGSSVSDDGVVGGGVGGDSELAQAKAFLASVRDEYGVQPDVTTFNSLIRIAVAEPLEDCKRVSAMAAAEDIVVYLEGATQPNLRPTVVTYTSLLVGYAQCAVAARTAAESSAGAGVTDVSEAAAIAGVFLAKAEGVFYTRMPSAGIAPNAVTVSALANGLLSVGRAHHALELLSAAGDKNPSYYPPGLGLGESERDAQRQPFLGAVDLSAVQPDRSFFNTAMNAHRALGDVDGALNLLRTMGRGGGPVAEEEDRNPFESTTTATKARQKEKEKGNATSKEQGPYQIWRDFGRSNAEKNATNAERRAQWKAMTKDEQQRAVQAATVRKAEAREEELRGGRSRQKGHEGLLQVVASHRVGIDAVSVHTAISACCDAGRIADALDLALNTSTLPRPSAEAFNPIIHALTLDGRERGQVLEQAASSAPSDSALLEGLAERIYEGERWSPPALSAHKGAASSGSGGQGLERAWGLFQEMRCGHHVSPDACSLHVLIEAHLRQKEPERALLAWHLVRSYDASAKVDPEAMINTAACNAKLKALGAFLRHRDQEHTSEGVRSNAGPPGVARNGVQSGARRDVLSAARAAVREETASFEAVLKTTLTLVERMVGRQPEPMDGAGDAGAFRHGHTRPDTQTLNAALGVCTAASTPQRAAVAGEYTRKIAALLLPSPSPTLEHRRTQGVRRDAATSRQLIKGAAGRGSLAEAFREAAMECERGGRISDRTYSVLLSACLATRDTDEAVALLERAGFVRLSVPEALPSSAKLSRLLPLEPLASTSTECGGDEGAQPVSRRIVYYPTLLRLLRVLTTASTGASIHNRALEVARLAQAVDTLASQCPGRDDGGGDFEGAAALDAYILVAGACLRLGGQPELLRRVIGAAKRVGIQLENRMALSSDLPGLLGDDADGSAAFAAGTVLWGSRAAAGTVAGTVTRSMNRLSRAIQKKKKVEDGGGGSEDAGEVN